MDGSMQEFWDARAREDPFYFVDDRQRYGAPDLDEFWAGGRDALGRFEDILGFQVAPEDAVVEVGCGLGRMTRALAARAASVRAVDISPEMLDRARSLTPDAGNVEWLLGDGVSLAGIEDASCDLCFSFVVFQHIPDPEVTLGYVAEIGRVLRPGGRAAFQVSNDPSVHRPPGLAGRGRRALLARLGRVPRGQHHPSWIGSSVDLARLERTMGDAGMVLERVWGEGTQHCLVLGRRAKRDVIAATRP